MQFSKKVKKLILNNFIDIFTRISNKEYQKRVWIKGEGPEADAFDDTVNEFFIECDSIIDNYHEFEITDYQSNLLKNFRDRFRLFTDENHWPPEFIESAEWDKISDMAKEILKAFNYSKR